MSLNIADSRNSRASLIAGQAIRRLACRLVAATVLCGALPALAQTPSTPGSEPPARTGALRVGTLEAELIADRVAVQPGGRIELGVRLRHDPAWHTYWRNSGDSGLPTTVEPAGPAGSTFGALRWPAPKRIWIGPLANYGYEGEVVLPFTASLPDGLGGASARFEARVAWLVCKEVCVPGEARLALDLPVIAKTGPQAAASRDARLFEDMAQRTPDPASSLAVQAYRRPGKVSLVFETPSGMQAISSASYFPYAAGLISPPAPQALMRTERGWRIDLVTTSDGATADGALDGLLWADGRALESRSRAASGEPPAATLVSIADRADQLGTPATGATAPTAAKPGGLLAAAGLQPGASDRGPLSTSTPIANPGASPMGAADTVPDTVPDSPLFLALGLGLLGGLILNLMPCVFPVIGLKVMGFASSGAGSPAARRQMKAAALAFVAGIVLSFWLLGGLMLALRAAGSAVGWGFQLQSPAFVAAMALLFLAVGLNFSGVFEMGLALTRLGGDGATRRIDTVSGDAASDETRYAAGGSLAGAFGSGCLAVLVATPCTAPFMGSALGFTLSQPALEAMAVFTAIAVGMGAPYLLLGWFPAWVARLPRPGRWMQTLRELLAFPMYASAAWLAWVLAQQAGADALLRLLLAAVLVGLAAWAWGRYATPAADRMATAVGIAAASLATALMLLWALGGEGMQAAASPAASFDSSSGSSGLSSGLSSARSPASPDRPWQAWSEQRVLDALALGHPVFVDFTAAWCVTCQANKQLALERQPVIEAFARSKVVTLRADWTQRDPAIAAALARHGRNGVPLYLVYHPGRVKPVVLPELLTAAIVIDALR
jgi:thiol:disulfide interchange protein DsbD